MLIPTMCTCHVCRVYAQCAPLTQSLCLEPRRVHTRLQQQVVGVAEHELLPGLADLLMRHGLDGPVGRHGHEPRGVHNAVRRVDPTHPAHRQSEKGKLERVQHTRKWVEATRGIGRRAEARVLVCHMAHGKTVHLALRQSKLVPCGVLTWPWTRPSWTCAGSRSGKSPWAHRLRNIPRTHRSPPISNPFP